MNNLDLTSVRFVAAQTTKAASLPQQLNTVKAIRAIRTSMNSLDDRRVLIVLFAHAVVYEPAVVVKILHTPIAAPAVFGGV